jgi:hypothetical protein
MMRKIRQAIQLGNFGDWLRRPDHSGHLSH